ncbi:MAG: short-chain dehydrogenase, partial [Verrucomicrobiales bacterium]
MNEKTVEKLFDLKGKTCLITGASGYLGGAMARALAEAGGRVVVTSRELDRAVEVAGQLPDPNNVNHLGMVLDHMDVDGLPERFQTIFEKAGCIDVLINNGHEHCPNDWTVISGEQFTR